MNSFALGAQVRDKITCFIGTVIGKVSYITGCDQYLVQPRLNKDGAHVESRWFDVMRLEKVCDDVISLGNEAKDSGPDRPAPTK